ncbi:LysM peptidoglycan-binding domain-containing protein [Clostridium luticellarii]|uniref:Spore germination protein YaaH n=1 Tax=Clostridium luticellarii TaxID=1691940 RepID=A0A2T0BBV7_9CLOT|nr:glycoside hydrolase family 18 protein [Clostridium luticellarii]PRR81322.1 Spore germination protein YaaH [Clostridium luticellarii]
MNIYVVRSGDSVWSIARRFGVAPSSIIDANGLRAEESLIVGQSLVIPTSERAYRVRPGDSLWSISQRFGVSVDSIVQLNDISNPAAIYPGMVIRIPENSKNYGVIETNGFIQPSTAERERDIINNVGPYLTYVTPFSHHVTAEGGLTPLRDETIIEVGRDNRVAPLLSVTNISGANFDTDLISTILNNENLQDTLINNIIKTMSQKEYYGVIIDFERIPPSDRGRYNSFLEKLVSKAHPLGYVVGTALAPKTYDVTSGAWHGAHDYASHGRIVDFVVIMTYEWGWSGGPPMAVAPLNEVRKVISYAVSVIPPNKILMGIPMYGYDWTLPYTPGGEFAESIGHQEAVNRARRYGAEIKFDEAAQSPYFNYVDEERRQHVVWFEDARSIQAKYRLVNEYGLRGVSYWTLAQPFPQNWYILNNMFEITKVIPAE